MCTGTHSIWNEVNPECAGLRARQPGRRCYDGDQLLGLPGHSGDHHEHGRLQTGIASALHSPSPSTLSHCTPLCTASCSRTHAHTHTCAILITSLHPLLKDHTLRLTHTSAMLNYVADWILFMHYHHSLNAGRWPERGGSLIPPRSRIAVQETHSSLRCSISFIPIDAQCDSFCKWNLINVPLSKHCFVCSSRQI